MVIRALLILIVGLSLPAASLAAGELGQVERRVAETLSTLNPELSVDAVNPTPIAGLYEVLVGGQVLYFSADGRYLLQGDLVDLREQRSLTEARRQQQRLAQLAQVPAAEYITYPARGDKRHSVVIVTDIDCPYCQRMHRHMAELNERGVEVRYLQMPRAGVNSPSYGKAVAVYCADNQLEAMDRAKAGESVPQRQCDHPVREHLQLVRQLGINATPTVVFENGAVHPGYLNTADLLARIAQEQSTAD